MRNKWLPCLWFTCVAIAQSPAPPSVSDVLGTWEGESICTIRDSPCHDEHVVYQIASQPGDPPLKIDAYKIVNGQQEFMGTITCDYKGETHILTCTAPIARPNIWEFTVSGSTMNGTLKVDADKHLFRNIRVERPKPASEKR